MAPMIIHVHAVCWNEEKILPYFLRHYAFADRIFLYDNESTDRSMEIAESFPNVTPVAFKTNGELRDDILRDIKDNTVTVSHNADWVITGDADELIWHPNLQARLAECEARGVGVIAAEGFQMVADSFPNTDGQIYGVVKQGVAAPQYNKPSIFSPCRVDAMNYCAGAHHASPVFHGKPVGVDCNTGIKLLHFVFMGLDYTADRYARRMLRLSDINRKNNWGVWEDAAIRQEFQRTRAAAKSVMA